MKLCTFLAAIGGLLVFVLCGPSFGQTATQRPAGTVPQLPGGALTPGQFPGTQGMTQQQMQQMMMLRAMQSRGNGSAPKTGYPQILGPGPFANPQPVLMPPAQAPTSARKSASAERRAAVKAQLENRNRAAKAEAEQKKREKAQAAKAKK